MHRALTFVATVVLVLAATATAKPPIIIVPGVGGTVFEEKSDPSNVCWISIFNANSDIEDAMLVKYNATTGVAEPIDSSEGIIVPERDHGLYAIANLDPNAVWPVSKETTYFQTMISDLESKGYVAGVDLFGFPYDWRQSNRLPSAMASLKSLVENVTALNNGKAPSIVSHSMGCLVTLSFFDTYGADTGVNRWIAIAPPFLGGTGAMLEAVTQGYVFGDILLKAILGQELGLSSPAFYEILPNEFHTWNIEPTMQIDWANGTDVEWGPDAYVPIFEEALANFSFTHNGVVYPSPFNMDIFNSSRDARESWYNSVQPDGVDFYFVYGHGIDTKNAITYSGITDVEQILTATQGYLYVDGDGTVTTESSNAVPAGWTAIDSLGRNGVAHVALVSDGQVISQVEQWLGVSEKSDNLPMNIN